MAHTAPTGTGPHPLCFTGGKQLPPAPNAAGCAASFILSRLRAGTFGKAIKNHSLHT